MYLDLLVALLHSIIFDAAKPKEKNEEFIYPKNDLRWRVTKVRYVPKGVENVSMDEM